MTPAPLSKVLRIVAKLSNLSETDNRPELLDIINGVIEMMYRNPAFTLLYFQAHGCVLINRFLENCRNIGGNSFLGVVMPSQVRNVRELNTDGWMFQITEERVAPLCFPGSWHQRTAQTSRPAAEHLPPRLLEQDIPTCGDSRVVTFHSDSPDDCGKAIGLRYVDLNNNEQRVDVILGPTRVATETSVGEILELTFPERSGFITVQTDNGAFLGKYHPSILIPTHEWFRLEGGCCGMKVQYRGLKEPVPVVFDTDMVPFSDIPKWKLALKIYENMDAMELTPGQTNRLAGMAAQLAATDAADMDNDSKNFNTLLFSESTRAALGTGRMFARGRGFGLRSNVAGGWRAW